MRIPRKTVVIEGKKRRIIDMDAYADALVSERAAKEQRAAEVHAMRVQRAAKMREARVKAPTVVGTPKVTSAERSRTARQIRHSEITQRVDNKLHAYMDAVDAMPAAYLWDWCTASRVCEVAGLAYPRLHSRYVSRWLRQEEFRRQEMVRRKDATPLRRVWVFPVLRELASSLVRA